MIFRAAIIALALGFAALAGAQSQPADPILEAGKINARLAMEYLKRDQLKVAQEKIEKALQQNPKDVNVQLSAGLVYERLHEMKVAEKHFKLALRANPESPEAQNALGAFFCRNKQQAKGEEMFLKPQPTRSIARRSSPTRTQASAREARAISNRRSAICARPSPRRSTIRKPTRSSRESCAGVGDDLQARAFVGRFLAIAPATRHAVLRGDVEVALKDEVAATAFRERL